MSPQALQAGWAVADITPSTPIRLGGYAARKELSRGIHDRLGVYALTLSNGTTRAIILVADILHVEQDLVEDVRARIRAALPQATIGPIWPAATHTHGGPEVGGVFGYSTVDAAWRESLINAMVTATSSAIAAERPVGMGWAGGAVTGVATNRDHPETPADLALDLLILYEVGSDVPAAILGSFPAHPTVMGADNLAITADLPGAFRRSLASRLGSATPWIAPATGAAAPWIALATGAAADISSRHVRRGQDFSELDRLGGMLAARAEQLIARAAPVVTDRPPVTLAARSLRIPLALKSFPTEAALADMARQLHAARPTSPSDARTIETARQGVEGARRLAEKIHNLPRVAELDALRIGPVALVTVPGELYNALGARLRSATGQPV
ncbi:MAG: neutral/alkaline non-lysosomal ceramidase N-terminal domain-containing protein, partial [Chloroflexota bacterium]